MARMRATRAIVYLSHLQQNIRALHAHLEQASGGTGTRICVAVKADGYGHGAVEVAKAAVQAGADHLAVATAEEGSELRQGGLRVPILLYSLVTPEELGQVVEARLTPLVADLAYAEHLDREAAAHRRVCSVHAVVDTGMGRIGCRPDELPILAEGLSRFEHLELHGVGTHFPDADGADPSFTEHQIERFAAAVQAVRARGIDPGIVHAANSGASVHYPASWLDMVRPGISVYGYYPSTEQARPLPLTPVMELETRIVFLKQVPAGTPISYGLSYYTERESWIATLPVGYGDGVSRLLSNNGEVLVRPAGTEPFAAPIVGRVCMDQIMINLGERCRAALYDRVTLFGPDPAGPSAETVALRTGTIPYEVTCNISSRVPRVYCTEPFRAGSEPAQEQVDDRL
jgi:alanine racemase